MRSASRHYRQPNRVGGAFASSPLVAGLFGGFLLCASAMPMEAQAAPTKEESAKAHYAKGALLYRQADYAGAWLEFTSAYQLVQKPELLFNMGRCEVKLGRSEAALAHFREYLEKVPSDPDAEGLRQEMSALQADVERKKKLEQEKALSQPPPPPPKVPVKWPVYGTIAGAGTVLLGVVTVSLLGSVSSQYKVLQESCAPTCPSEQIQPLERQATAGYVFLGLTLAGAATTAGLLVWELRRPRERAANSPLQGIALSPSLYAPRSASLTWRF